jgi:hypothetical protein
MSSTRPPIASTGSLDQSDLAWRQTSLMIGVGALTMTHVLSQFTGSGLWIIPGLAGVLFAVWVWWQGGLRYSAFLRAMTGRPDRRTPDGKLLFAVVVFVWGAGLTAGAALFFIHR